MRHAEQYTNTNINSNKVEFEENKVLLWLEKFWQFSLFYGNYIGSMHGSKNRKS